MFASSLYNSFGKKLFDSSTKIVFGSDTIKIALCNSSYTPDRDAHDFFDDITNEVSGTGYSAGGATLANVSVTQDNTNDRITIDADDASWSSSSIANARYAIIYKSTGTASTSPLIAVIDLGSNRSSSLSNFVIQFNASGIIRLSL